MGGHGGLNILPQKRWNVYNYDARAKVEKDRRLQQEKNENLNKNKDEGQASSRYEFLKLQRHKKNIPEHKQEKSQISLNYLYFFLKIIF